MQIKRIKIYGLWNRYNIDWNLNNTGADILSGDNGSGKSTILQVIVDSLLKGLKKGEVSRIYNKAEIEFVDGTVASAINFADDYDKLKIKATQEESYQQLFKDVTRKMPTDEDTSSVIVEAGYMGVVKNGKKIKLSEFYKELDLNVVSSFDNLMTSDDDYKRREELEREGVKTELDLKLYHLQEQYSFYLADLATKIELKAKNKETIDNEFVEELYRSKDKFIEIINSFFYNTRKKVDTRKSKLSFILEDDIPISMYQLSSGEKQLLYIFLIVLLQKGKDYILLMDEPEISLHVDWQKNLITNIKKLNPHCQLIIATHSPSLIINGWQNNVKNLEDIKVRV